MKTAKEYFSAFSECGSFAHFEAIIRSTYLNLENAEEGLANHSRPNAAHTECYIYSKSNFVLNDIYAYFAALTHTEDKDSSPVFLPAREMRIADECPAYLDIFERYIKDFGDAWYDPPEHRNIFFRDIFYAFRWICNYLLVMADISFKNDGDVKRAYTLFMRDFNAAALMDESSERALTIPLLHANFLKFRPTLDAAIDKLINLEKDLLLKETDRLGVLRDCSFASKLNIGVRFATANYDFLCSLPGDERPLKFPEDKRYEPIANRMWIWSVMPPSVTRFVESCKLLEQAAVLAAKGFPDFNFSSRTFIHVCLSGLDAHPKYSAAKNMLESRITDEEKSSMGEAFSRLAKSLLRLRKVLKDRTCFGEEDIDEYDRFIAGLPRILDSKGKSYVDLLFAGGGDIELDGFNSEMLYDLSGGARKLAYIPPYNNELEIDEAQVNTSILRAYKSGNEEVIRLLFEKIEKKYFKEPTPKKETPVKIADPLQVVVKREIAMPGAKDKIQGRFSVAPKTARIVDTQHNEAPYYLPAYEGLTQNMPIGYINRLLSQMGIGKGTCGDPYGGWIKFDRNWRMSFKEGVYKRFKDEQIELGTKGNKHYGECRIIPDNLFKELTLAKISTAE